MKNSMSTGWKMALRTSVFRIWENWPTNSSLVSKPRRLQEALILDVLPLASIIRQSGYRRTKTRCLRIDEVLFSRISRSVGTHRTQPGSERSGLISLHPRSGYRATPDLDTAIGELETDVRVLRT